jgi:Bacteriophage Sf6, terminase small subunit-like
MAPAKKQEGVPPTAKSSRVLQSRGARARARGTFTKGQQGRIEQRAAQYLRALPLAQSTPAFDGKYTPELGDTLRALVADGVSLDNIVTLPNMPKLHNLLAWIADDTHPFRKIYYDAKRTLTALYEERAHDAAHKPLIQTIRTRREVLDREGNVVLVTEEKEIDNVERSKLIVNTTQWTLSHLQPKKHGKNPDVGSGGVSPQLQALFDSINSGPAKEDEE